MGWHDRVDFASLVGKTINLFAENGDSVLIECDDGTRYQMIHHQDCCESVYVEDVVGDLNDLLGTPILRAEERSEYDPKTTTYEQSDGSTYSYTDESGTWTFYELATIKGSVTIRWYGSSNGYYSERVDFEKLN